MKPGTPPAAASSASTSGNPNCLFLLRAGGGRSRPPCVAGAQIRVSRWPAGEGVNFRSCRVNRQGAWWGWAQAGGALNFATGGMNPPGGWGWVRRGREDAPGHLAWPERKFGCRFGGSLLILDPRRLDRRVKE